MPIQEAIHVYARERGLSLADATQTFMQAIVLKHLSAPGVRLIGGGALVFGHGSPRFSEDIDLTQVSDPTILRGGLVKSASEIEGWVGHPVTLTPPKKASATWRLVCRMGRAESLRLNVDCQEFPAYSVHPIVIQYPPLPTFVCEAMGLREIMAEKVIAVAMRRYLGGRDLFDLWFHWLRHDDRRVFLPEVSDYLEKKFGDRRIVKDEFFRTLRERLSGSASLERARTEWKRYLPSSFQGEAVRRDIWERCLALPEHLVPR